MVSGTPGDQNSEDALVDEALQFPPPRAQATSVLPPRAQATSVLPPRAQATQPPVVRSLFATGPPPSFETPVVRHTRPLDISADKEIELPNLQESLDDLETLQTPNPPAKKRKTTTPAPAKKSGASDLLKVAIDALDSMGESQKQHLVQQQQQLLEISQQQNMLTEFNDKFFVLGKGYGEMLRTMTSEQFQLANVLINNILFLGNTGDLDRSLIKKVML
jgi:chemotaxis protein histidine kinase CheA